MIKLGNMKLADFNYYLPKSLIAQAPLTNREAAKLMVIDREKKSIRNDCFKNLAEYLKPGDVLVINETKVFPARARGRKISGGKIEILFLREESEGVWRAMIGGRVRASEEVILANNRHVMIVRRVGKEAWVRVGMDMGGWLEYLNKFGQMPIPPYIKRRINNKAEYQTVYAGEKLVGSVAAPTAGLHMSEKLLKNMKKRGVEVVKVCLHVGKGTFEPVECEHIKNHRMEREWGMISKKAMKQLRQAQAEKRRIFALGTTTTRLLEGVFSQSQPPAEKYSGWINLFIYPGYTFKVVEGLITNFHLPKSTLLMLVEAFAGSTLIKKAYRQAISEGYRFYSFGDGMIIL